MPKPSWICYEGLSPRGRGKRIVNPPGKGRVWSIPAWAGETDDGPAHSRLRQVYPRVGGGNKRQGMAGVESSGLSPRGRGKPQLAGRRGAAQGSIPAWAGETQFLRDLAAANAVYPRVGGGNFRSLAQLPVLYGLSPRGRGKRPSGPLSGWRSGSIPAWAGETLWHDHPDLPPKVYPRVGGGNPIPQHGLSPDAGLSPRGRGKRRRPIKVPKGAGSIPAWAGETSSKARMRLDSAVYPRVGGGNWRKSRAIRPLRGLSPRGRGKRRK